MKSYVKSADPQLNLALLDRAPTELPRNERQELSLALVELLVRTVVPSQDQRKSTGGPNESETHE